MAVWRRGAVLAPVLVLWGCGGLRSAYEREVRATRAADPQTAAVLEEGDVATLPAPVQRFLRSSGYVGAPRRAHAEVVWSESRIRMGPERKWLRLETRQLNGVAEPSRFAYMRARLFGVFPFEGKDTYSEGHGRMHMKLLGLFTVGDDQSAEMDQSALVTILAEALLVPSYAVAPYIAWEAVDERSARATIRHRGIQASGVFHFNERDEFVRFETRDRFYATRDGGHRLVPWSAEVLEYVEQDGLKLPRSMRAVWHLDEGDYEYFRGTIAEIR